MSGKRFDIGVRPEDTFETADKLGRKGLAESMTSLVSVSTDPLVVALDDEWGTGKTHFLKLWQCMLQENGIPAIYFNAFECDFSGDAFVSLSASLAEALGTSTKSGKKPKKVFLKKAARFGKIVSRSLVNVAIRAGTAGAIDAADAGDAAISQAGKETSQKFEHLIAEKSNFKGELENFRQALNGVRLALQSEGEDHPLVFIVDELDRCRPDFALDVLECLKHFFETEKNHFVLGVNLNALEKSVVSIYGGDLSSRGYLSRFIDYKISFSSPQYSTKEKELKLYARHLWARAEALAIHSDVADGLIDIIAGGVSRNSGSLRDVNRIFSVLYLCLATISEKTFKAPPLIGGLVLMKYYDPRLFEKAKEGAISFGEVAHFFEFRKNTTEYDENERSTQWMHEWWATFLGGDVSPELKKSIKSSLFTYNLMEDETVIPICARNIVDRFWQG